MDVHKRHSLFNRTQEQASFTVFQPGFFNSELEPESLEDFDFEKMMRVVFESLFDVAPALRISNRPEYNETWSEIKGFLGT